MANLAGAALAARVIGFWSGLVSRSSILLGTERQKWPTGEFDPSSTVIGRFRGALLCSAWPRAVNVVQLFGASSVADWASLALSDVESAKHVYKSKDYRIIVGIRPEQVTNKPESELHVPLCAIVEMSEPMGSECLVYLKTGSDHVTARVHGEQIFHTREDLMVYFDLASSIRSQQAVKYAK